MKEGVPFHWDENSQKEFNALKYVLVQTSFLYPMYYQHDYFLYVVVAITTIAMVLVQEDDVGVEHSIYYFICYLNDTGMKYTQTRNLALLVL